jgi:hypothetical protein
MAEFFYMNINFEEEKPFVYHMNKIPYADLSTALRSGRDDNFV